MLELHALVREAKVPHEEAIVVLAIRLGQYEGRHLSVSDIAAATSLPLSSVSRHIKTLRSKGRIRSIKRGRKIVQYIQQSDGPEDVEYFYNEAYGVVRRATQDISRMEGTIDIR